MIGINDPDSFLKKIRYCHAAWGILKVNNQLFGQQFFPTSIENFMRAIDKCRGNEDKKLFYARLKRRCDNNLINEEKLNWINKKNPRVCYFVYQKLKQTKADSLNLYLMSQKSFLDERSANKIWISTGASTLVEKINEINKTINCINVNIEAKERYINDLKGIYTSTLKTNNFEWVILNETLHEWFYSYMDKNLPDKNRNFIPDSFIDNPFYSAIEMYDDWQPSHNSEKELFKIKLRKAYQQQSYRQNKAGKEKTYTYSMPLNIEDKMTEISRKLGVTRNKILTDLINEKHSSLCLGDRKQTKNII
ncbi:MAG: hypothetical protein ACI88H_000089 [Cocleimonas sp.]|jgi:hypothetical protein